MPRRIAAIVTLLLLAACGRTRAPSAADSTAAAKRVDDSVLAIRTRQAPAFADTARRTLAILLKHPESAVFDSVVVVQPPQQGGVWPTPWVCGRIGGNPGIGGRNTLTPFIYQNRINVFVLDKTNGTAFTALLAKGCDNPDARVLLK
ncbi:MAG TPA: hypothetical protein VGL65_00055 [Gemmatimonadales bacterium]|jgi:hypothetical protein